MSDPDFQLVDLVSQAVAVKSVLAGKSEQEKIDWLKSRGLCTIVPSPIPFGPHPYVVFESTTGIRCSFFIKGDEFFFIGDNTVFTVPNTNRIGSARKPWWNFW